MLRQLLLGLSRSRRAQAWLMKSPPIRRAAYRFVAGEALDEAIAVVRTLNEQGISATLDHLGENTQTRQAALQAAQEYLKILAAIHQNNLNSHISLKLTQMGLDLDEDLCFESVKQIIARAQQYKNFVRIDMESSAYTDRTLKLYERLRGEGYENVGVVIQSYLYRSRQDVERLIQMGANVRLCKGAYAEPPAVAFPSRRAVNENYLRLLELLWSAPAQERGTYVAIATHDEKIMEWAKRFALAHGIAKDRFEFQMLYGIRRDLQTALTQSGYRVRVYVSYGREWYPYFMRRLAERPANLFFLARHLFRK